MFLSLISMEEPIIDEKLSIPKKGIARTEAIINDTKNNKSDKSATIPNFEMGGS